MEGNMIPIENYLSATTLSKKTAATLDMLEKGDVGEFIILKNNTPKAILVSIEQYEAIQEELEDLRLTALALARLQTFKPEEALSHKAMMEKFNK